MSKFEIKEIIRSSIPAGLLNAVPVDPFSIARGEGIVLIGHESLDGFDGCLSYRADRRKFCLHYVDCGLTDPRTRYTVGHELGHYFLPHHRQLLLQGSLHGSKVYELHSSDREAEANHFSALLLAPTASVRANLRDVGAEQVRRLAEHFQISLSAAARRMVEETPKACAAVFSKNGRVEYVVFSDEMEAREIFGLKSGTPVPEDSLTANGVMTSCGRPEKQWFAEDWFPTCPAKTRGVELWEEVVPIGSYGCITLLVHESDG